MKATVLVALSVGLALVALLLAAIAGVSDFLVAMLCFVLFAGWAVALALAILGSVVYGGVRMSRGGLRSFALTASLLVALLVGLAGAVPALYLSSWVKWEVQRPVREAVGRDLIDQARRENWQGKREITLPTGQRWLSDGGQVDVCADRTGASVWYWDSRGILDGYSASVFVADPDAKTAPGNALFYGPVERGEGHWWSSVPE